MNNHLLIQTALCIIHSALLLPTAEVVADEKKTEVNPSLIYPWCGAGGAPVQTLAYMIAGAGLQITALDGKSQEKTFGTEKQNATIWYRCPDEGRPGAANTPDFAVETAVFRGDWWIAAKRYRKWALQQEWAAKGPLSRRGDFTRPASSTSTFRGRNGKSELQENQRKEKESGHPKTGSCRGDIRCGSRVCRY